MIQIIFRCREIASQNFYFQKILWGQSPDALPAEPAPLSGSDARALGAHVRVPIESQNPLHQVRQNLGSAPGLSEWLPYIYYNIT